MSSPQLLLTLARKKLEKGKLYNHLVASVKTWKKGDLIAPEADETAQVLGTIAVAGEEKFLAERTYIELFYNYRNHLVHNFREPGYGMELADDGDRPYYHSMAKIEEPDKVGWQLVFPVNFFLKLCTDGLIELEKYLRESNLDPYDLYPFGDEWTKV